jgi:hypothetical protein
MSQRAVDFDHLFLFIKFIRFISFRFYLSRGDSGDLPDAMLPPSLRRIQRLARLPIQRVAIRQLLERSASVSLGHVEFEVEFGVNSRDARGTTGSGTPFVQD